MEEFSHLGRGNSRGSFICLSSSSVATAATTTTPPTPAPNSVAYGPNLYHAALLENPSPPTFKAEAGSSKNQSQEHWEISRGDEEAIKAKIISHPRYSSLLEAYMDCQKVGAPPGVIARLSAIARELEACPSCRHDASADPDLDQFMEAFCDLLVKYRVELKRPLQEATDFLKKVESQFGALINGNSARSFSAEGKREGVGSSEEDQYASRGEAELPETDPHAEDKELKRYLLKKYGGNLSSLRQEVSKKKHQGKLPKDARQKLLNWWELHCKWPYPTEKEKAALAESTGLDPKQINNWFINQRKRHWKPSDEMQFVMMDGFHRQNAATAAAFFVERPFMGDGMYRLGP